MVNKVNKIKFTEILKQQEGGVNMKKGIVIFLLLLLSIGIVMATGEIEQTTNKLNFWNSANHTVYLKNNGAEMVTLTSSVPSGWSWVSGSGCTESTGTITCSNVASGSTVSYIISSPSSGVGEYELTTVSVTANNSYTGNDIKFLRIKDGEIFHHLIEYGRGRGNYFYSTSGKATSGGTAQGYPYIPANYSFELNYLHKIFNIKQYFGLASADAQDVSFECSYPNRTVIREHLVSGIAKSGNNWLANYSIDLIEGSWERMGYLGQSFDLNQYNVGDTITISCSNIVYYLPAAYGNVTVDSDSITLTFVDDEPLSVTASSNPSTIGNGTSEVEITYTFNNTERYPLDDLRIEIQAPADSNFIGVRGELWGYAKDKYIYELTELPAYTTAEITLVARFDTSSETQSTLALSQGIKAEFIPTWEINAYNPGQIQQSLTVSDTISINYSQTDTLRSIQDELDHIYDVVNSINSTVDEIKSIVTTINSTVNRIETNTIAINSTVNNIYIDTQTIIGMLNCTQFSEVCDRLQVINSTVNNIETIVTDMNTTMIDRFDRIDGNLSYIIGVVDEIEDKLDCNNTQPSGNVICDKLDNITSYVVDINTTVHYINETRWGNITAQMLYDKIDSSASNLTLILTKIRQLKEFEEEAVFLVTDSVVKQQEAKNAVANGNYDTAIEKLNTAVVNLEKAEELLKLKSPQNTEIRENKSVPIDPIWLGIGIGTLAIVTILILVGLGGNRRY